MNNKSKKNYTLKVNQHKQGTFKYLIGLIVCFLIRIIPFRPPNLEPIMTTTMPFSKKWGWLAGAIFGFLSIFIYDLINPTIGFARIGIWTFVTAIMYALVGIAGGFYLKNKENKIRYYFIFAVIATLVYDFITGPIMSSLIFHMSFAQATIGQIPFTIMHLLGNIIGAVVISPLLYKWVINNKNLDTDIVINKIKNLTAI